MQVKAKTSFVHGSLALQQGESAEVDDHTAQELAAAGLVDLAGEPDTAAKQAPVADNKMALEPDNKTVHQPIQEATTKK
jgi:hypothetical protein